MKKIGRNALCPCGSNIKYKKCCIHKTVGEKEKTFPVQSLQASLRKEIVKIQQAAVEVKSVVREFGVFVLFSVSGGDAWLLEISEMDALRVASGGEKHEVSLEENPETIEINWSHSFKIKSKQFEVTSYTDDTVESLEGYPTTSIKSAIKKIKTKYSSELLESVHINEQPA